jgi:hypothetical protein
VSVPALSVVMGVRNAGEGLNHTLDALLVESRLALEVIAVDDGSTDATPEILSRRAQGDARLRPLRQAHEGLTRALVRGCAAASAPYIARQDAGAWSRPLPGRFEQALALLDDESIAMASCGTRFLGPDGEHLQDVVLTAAEADEGLRHLRVDRVRGPSSHGAVVFRRSLYEQVGGYRPCFRFAQDLDLWLRLVERGRHVATSEVLVERGLSPTGTSCANRALQVRLAACALDAARLRRAGADEAPALAAAGRISDRAAGATATRRALARGHYFLGSLLRGRNRGQARRHFRRAVAVWPLHLKAWYRWATTR